MDNFTSLSVTLGRAEREEEPGAGEGHHLDHLCPGLVEPEPVLRHGGEAPGVPGQQAGQVAGGDPQVSLLLVLVDREVPQGGVSEQREVLVVLGVED